MTDAQIEDAMAKVLGDIAPEVQLDAVPADEPLRQAVDLDSMDFLHFIIGLHRELDVEIPEADYAKLTTKSDIVSYLQKKTAEEQPPSNRPAS